MRKVVGLILGLLPISVYAECVPVPDCASIGYTETSCEGGSLKCPFDTSRLLCVPCDSSFRFSCVGENIVSAVGSACNGKYASCTCVEGATFINGECVCNNSCNTIGNILYSDYSCNSCIIENKTPVGVVVYADNTKRIARYLENKSASWVNNLTDADGNILVSKNTAVTGLSMFATADEAVLDFDGFNNTKLIADFFGEDISGGASIDCYRYAPDSLPETKNKWYLPALGELSNYIYKNQSVIDKTLQMLGKTKLNYLRHWSSSQYSAGHAWYHIFYGNEYIHSAKNDPLYADCLLAF